MSTRSMSAPIRWREEISRGTSLALMHNFTSFADAVKELVDNSVNFAWGQRLSVEVIVDRSRDLIVVESDGGRGMGAFELNTWLNWGSGDEHGADDLSRYHQGGKAACGYLGRSVRIWSKARDSADIWCLEDEDWGTRTIPRDFGVPTPVVEGKAPQSVEGAAFERGHVRIEISRLNRSRRDNKDDLRRALASTYRTILGQDDLQIAISYEGKRIVVEPLEIPLAAGSAVIQIPTTKIGGHLFYGWAGRADLQQTQSRSSLRPGMRLVQNGRLICDNEWFGYNYQGKGALNALIGELHLSRFTPVPNKTDFIERGDDLWLRLGEEVLRHLQPLIAELRAGGPESKVTKREKELAKELREELGRVLATLNDDARSAKSSSEQCSEEPEQAGRARPRKGRRRNRTTRSRGPNGHPSTPRTPPPGDAVGSLVRLVSKITGGRTEPPIRISAWEPSERSAWVDGRWLDINKNYPLYREFRGAKAYLAETAILELSKPSEGETMAAQQYIGRVELLMSGWMQEVARGSESDADIE